MKIHKVAAWGCLLLAGEAGAQVANDSCPSAQDLGLILFSPTCYISGAPSQLLVDSTDFAVPNFPYPSNPGTCFGYWAVPNVPANDRWYRFLLPSGDYVEYTCSALDSLQLSWWQGYDCAYLSPLDCSILLPGETIHRLRTGSYHPGIDTLYLQIASTSTSSDARYELCYRDTWWGTTPISYGTGTPTPVLCFEHEVSMISASDSISADGSAGVSVLAGNGPFSILWADGSTDFDRFDLLYGSYPFTISDAQNCQIHDTVFVDVMLSTGVPIMLPDNLIETEVIDGWLCYSARSHCQGRTVVLMDMMGRVFFTTPMTIGRHRMVSVEAIKSLPFMVLETSPDGKLLSIQRIAPLQTY